MPDVSLAASDWTTTGGYIKAKTFRIKEGSLGWAEKFIQDLIHNDPEVLGLGPFSNVEREFTQPGGGRVDLILSGDRNSARYVVEIQLGDTDPSHIIRTIEYWNSERKAKPHIQHIAVLVAEEITGRFYSVISLFNEHIPVIALKMTAIDVDGRRSVLFTKVLDVGQKQTKTDKQKRKPDKAIGKSGVLQPISAPVKELINKLVEICAEVVPAFPPVHHQKYTSLKTGTRNLISFLPKKNAVKIMLHTGQSSEMDGLLASSDLEYVFDPIRRTYRVFLSSAQFSAKEELLRKAFSLTARAGSD